MESDEWIYVVPMVTLTKIVSSEYGNLLKENFMLGSSYPITHTV